MVSPFLPLFFNFCRTKVIGQYLKITLKILLISLFSCFLYIRLKIGLSQNSTDTTSKIQRSTLKALIRSRKSWNIHKISDPGVNPHTPVAQKVADEVVFRRFQAEGVEFFKSDLTDFPSDFWCASFGKYQFKPFQ